MNKSILSLGTNLGPRFSILQKTLYLVSIHLGTVSRFSSVYETEPWGRREQPPFLNLVLELMTSYDPLSLLRQVQRMESYLGKKTTMKYGPRTIDIDILFFNSEQINTPELSVPHPKIPERNFVLIPLVEIAPDLIHPFSGKTIRELCRECNDHGKVTKL